MSRAAWRILVADDDPTVGLLARAALAGDEFAVTVVEDGDQALASLENTAFDLALIDVEMPGVDGFIVAAAIRQRFGPTVPVVMVTGRSDPQFMARAEALHADHLAKPVAWGSLAGLVRSLLAQRPR